MSWYGGFRPYVSVAERRRKALAEMEKRRKKGLPVAPIVIEGRTIARTFWGQAWCDNLESYSDFANRLPRGRTYVRNGSVVHLEIEPGKIRAFVSGSELYKVEITIAPLSKTHWNTVKKECGGQVGSLVELLQGKLSKHVMDFVTRRGGGLFPKPSEIEMRCSCPDWAGMCKHVAAVMYGIGARLDQKPELLFSLRNVDHLELIAGAVNATAPVGAGKTAGRKTLAKESLADVFGIELTEKDATASVSPTTRKRAAKSTTATPKAASKKAPRKPATSVKPKATPKAAKAKASRAAKSKQKTPTTTGRRKSEKVVN